MSTPFSITDYKNQVPHKHCRSTEGQTRVEQFLDLIGRVLNWSESVTGFWVSFEKAICFWRHDMTVWLSGLISFFCLNSHFWCCESLQIPSFSITILSGYLVPSLTKRPAPVDSLTLVAYFRKRGGAYNQVRVVVVNPRDWQNGINASNF
jgi:hypothetical protein